MKMSISKIAFGLAVVLVVSAVIEARPDPKQKTTTPDPNAAAGGTPAGGTPAQEPNAGSPTQVPPPPTTTEAPNGSPIQGSDLATIALLAICSAIGRHFSI